MSKDKIFFVNDYSTVAHPNLINALSRANYTSQLGYGDDEYSNEARDLIKKQCGGDPDVFFLVGGTQVNMVFLSAALKSYQGVISSHLGHIATHETGAIESRGHKVLSVVTGSDGKVAASQIKKICRAYNEDVNRLHTVQPGGVYISQPTESGALYSKEELIGISRVCDENNLFLYVDGARMGYALSSKQNDVSLQDLHLLSDCFYIGGTKCGAMIGEALVINNKKFTEEVEYSIKPNGALLAKGMVLGLQFKELFTDNLYINICKKANEMAQLIAKTLKDCGFTLYSESHTNQQFVIVPDKVLEQLEKKYEFAVWEKMDDGNTVIRICTSWSTDESMVESLVEDIKKYRLN
ncbi:MAG: beta-eliminating lyase-related protein [Sphaerochaetaceae bacterium]|nr:beta-eliminating lyase-related protein [Sphaerochaetaceae bacterium]